MIRYTLKCDADHRFEAWFRSSDDCDAQIGQGQVTCALCGSTGVQKALMAPATRAAAEGAEPCSLATPSTALETAIAELRRKIAASADYVGDRFAAEARRMHEGEAAGRGIWGEATRAEARALAEDGIPVAPLPFLTRRDD